MILAAVDRVRARYNQHRKLVHHQDEHLMLSQTLMQAKVAHNDRVP
jgi:hypothetical protein